jgi:hypothetical protein
VDFNRRGLSGAEMVRICYSEDAADVEVRVPTLTSAICVKAAAALDARTAGHPRHIQDTAFLLACVEDLRPARDVLSDTEARARRGS